MSPSVLRVRTERALRHARATHGDRHPATWAAYGRAVAAWGRKRLGSLALEGEADLVLIHTAAIAEERVSARPGYANRRARRHGVGRHY